MLNYAFYAVFQSPQKFGVKVKTLPQKVLNVEHTNK